MIGILFYAEEENESVYDINMWRRLADNFDLDFYAFIDENQTYKDWSDGTIKCHKFASLENALTFFPDDMTKVFVDGNHDKGLAEFKHPHDNVVYVFGRDQGGFTENANVKGKGIKLPIKGTLHAHDACVWVLGDRVIRG